MNIGTNELNTKVNEGVLIVTDQQYEQMKADGIDDETLLKPGTYKLRRRKRAATQQELRASNIKVDVTMKLDLDVLNYFKMRAGEANAADYKIQINNLLRELMEREQGQKSEDVENRLLQNKDFIAALAAELKKSLNQL